MSVHSIALDKVLVIDRGRRALETLRRRLSPHDDVERVLRPYADVTRRMPPADVCEIHAQLLACAIRCTHAGDLVGR